MCSVYMWACLLLKKHCRHCRRAHLNYTKKWNFTNWKHYKLRRRLVFDWKQHNWGEMGKAACSLTTRQNKIKKRWQFISTCLLVSDGNSSSFHRWNEMWDTAVYYEIEHYYLSSRTKCRQWSNHFPVEIQKSVLGKSCCRRRRVTMDLSNDLSNAYHDWKCQPKRWPL